MTKKIHPISGLPELLPAQQRIFHDWINKIRSVFEQHGYAPIETPAFERLETLTSKGIAEHEIYTVRRLREDDGQKQDDADLALRFDLTVPLARYVSQHFADLVFPFRRYHIAPVWRGERAQKGRYRQLYQCDIDVLSDRPLSYRSDAEVIMILSKILSSLQPSIGSFHFYINHRYLLSGMLEAFGITQNDEILRTLDKRKKIPSAVLFRELQQWTDRPEELIQTLDHFSGPLRESCDRIANSPFKDSALVARALNELQGVADLLEAFGCPAELYRLDLSLARGLNYYTGIVLETFLDDHPGLGSISSGGRYDNLCEQFSARSIPGFGLSLGLSRLFHWYIEQLDQTLYATPAKIMIAVQDPATLTACCGLAESLRQKGCAVEQYLEYDQRSLGHQMKYADRAGIQYVIFASIEEVLSDRWIVKEMSNSQQTIYTRKELLEYFGC